MRRTENLRAVVVIAVIVLLTGGLSGALAAPVTPVVVPVQSTDEVGAEASSTEASTEASTDEVGTEASADVSEPLVQIEQPTLLADRVGGEDEGDSPTVATLDSRDLGAGATITLLRPAGRRDIDVAVADGLVLTGFRTSVLVPAAVHEVQVDIAVGGDAVFSASVAGGSTEDLMVTLETPIATDTVMSITVEERYGATCTSTAVESNALRLVDNEFFFERIETTPRTIADFFPPALERVIVVTASSPESSVRSAALELATALARRYPTMPTIDVVRLDLPAGEARSEVAAPPISDDPFTRTIVLTSADTAEMRVRAGWGGSYLEIAGPAGLIEEMAAAVSARELAFITKSFVSVEELPVLPVVEDLLGQRSLRDVGVRRLVASGSRVVELPIVLPQAAFGEPVEEIRVRLGGVALASSADGREPVVTLWFNGDLQDAIDYDNSGRFDLEFVIGPSEIQRDNIVLIRSEIPLNCGEQLPNHELTLDAASWVEATPGQSLPSSLDRFPQVAVGHLAVAAGDSSSELEVAMTMVGVLQGSSPLPIHPQAAPIERVLGGFSSGLVVTNGDGAIADAIARDLTTVQAGQLAFVSGEQPEDLAFLSTSITETSQDVLVVYSPTEQLSDTFTATATDQGWSAFGGNALGVRGSGDVVRSEASTAAVAAAQLATLSEPEREPTPIARQFGIGALAALLLVIAVLMIRFVFGTIRRLR